MDGWGDIVGRKLGVEVGVVDGRADIVGDRLGDDDGACVHR